jgi:SET domain-containing protein
MLSLPYLHPLMILPILVIAPSDKRGRGVFTTKNIAAKTTIEISPVLVLSEKDRAIVEKTRLFDYIFEWGNRHKKACIALGYISLYNHAYDANCEYEMDFDTELMTITTVREVKKGEELYINYNAVADDATAIWFDVK